MVKSKNSLKESPVNEISFFNRYTSQIEKEAVYGQGALKFIYKNSLGKYFFPLITGPLFSKLYGHFQNTPSSCKKIPSFINKFNIEMNEFLPENYNQLEKPYKNFNDFFIRKFKSGRRTFPQDNQQMGAVAEGRYLGWKKVQDEISYPVKGKFLTPSLILNNKKWDSTFQDGPMMIARLCPTDYHRFHFPDSGQLLDFYEVKGKLFSVNPMALNYKPDIFLINERHVSILETDHFGKIAYIEVGATCVGKIQQTFKQNESFSRGDEKGYFLFGGSTVIVIGEAGRWTPSDDILTNTDQGMETFIKLGDTVGRL